MRITNALKAQIITLVTTALALLTAFDVALTDGQQAAIIGAAGAALSLWIGLTYKNSPKRTPDDNGV